MNATVREIGVKELASIVSVHRLAFPGSGLSRLGDEAVRRYYEWQLTGPHESVALGAYDGPVLVGFCVAGVFRGALSGFVRANRWFLARTVARRPWLLSEVVVRRRSWRAAGALLTGWRRPPSRATAQASFGILAVAVIPSHQRRGIGRQLVVAAEDVARRRGFDRTVLTVGSSNLGAIRFYESLGWTQSTVDGAWSGRMERPIDVDRSRPPFP